jgi:hypothetical protein
MGVMAQKETGKIKIATGELTNNLQVQREEKV